MGGESGCRAQSQRRAAALACSISCLVPASCVGVPPCLLASRNASAGLAPAHAWQALQPRCPTHPAGRHEA